MLFSGNLGYLTLISFQEHDELPIFVFSKSFRHSGGMPKHLNNFSQAIDFLFTDWCLHTGKYKSIGPPPPPPLCPVFG